MENQEMSLKELFHRALVNPKELSSTHCDLLMQKFPYAQPLHFALERRKFLLGELDNLGTRAILLAGSPTWLYEYVQKPIQESAPLVETVDDDYVPFEELSWPVGPTAEREDSTSESADRREDEDTVEEPQKEQDELIEPAGQAQQPDVADDEQALETLVQEGIGGGDYFALHAKEQEQEHNDLDAVVSSGANTDEDISLYNDQLMPYSFRWWLHKTRLEYADTYRPFASPYLPVDNKPSFDQGELDRIILDQQIREHIIHLQSPEDKLSEEVRQRAVEYTRKDKTAEVIERFIREEPQIQPPPAENLNTENKARKSSEEQFDLVTETLANIYADQAMYVKAIEVYKKLILRFPEKKSYFAARIKELEEKLY